VLERVRRAATSVDELSRAAELGAAELAVVLTELELAGLVSVEEGIVRATG
jgi:predicted Rossmann fold nucleotide-binding protein DprA/Smf involved in DNA uptake